jgi:hypothetical protein
MGIANFYNLNTIGDWNVFPALDPAGYSSKKYR